MLPLLVRLTACVVAALAVVAAQPPLPRVNPKALDVARQLDIERKAKGRRSPLHGIPVISTRRRRVRQAALPESIKDAIVLIAGAGDHHLCRHVTASSCATAKPQAPAAGRGSGQLDGACYS